METIAYVLSHILMVGVVAFFVIFVVAAPIFARRIDKAESEALTQIDAEMAHLKLRRELGHDGVLPTESQEEE